MALARHQCTTTVLFECFRELVGLNSGHWKINLIRYTYGQVYQDILVFIVKRPDVIFVVR